MSRTNYVCECCKEVFESAYGDVYYLKLGTIALCDDCMEKIVEAYTEANHLEIIKRTSEKLL